MIGTSEKKQHDWKIHLPLCPLHKWHLHIMAPNKGEKTRRLFSSCVWQGRMEH